MLINAQKTIALRPHFSALVILKLKAGLLALTSMVILAACQKDVSETSEKQKLQDKEFVQKAEQKNDNGMTVTEMPFTAVAMIAYCHGENIRFTGTIENRVKTTVNANGNHYTRHFTVKGMTGVGVNALGVPTGTEYRVVGGAEMFSIKDAVFNDNGTLNLARSLTESDIVIHRGTLVFENIHDGTRVVARHDIQKVPGRGILQNRWLCGGN
jgi:hypothetical protein